MGKKLDAILGRTFKVSKFKSFVNLANSRLAVFKNQRQVRCNQAHSDVLQLLQQGHHERALLRVEQVIKEQNMLDVYVMMEGYCNLVVERVHLIEQDRNCPEELREAVSSLLFASTRCGDFPELQEIRAVLTSRFGKEFVNRAIELRNNCGVNPKMIQKLSTRQPDVDIRMKLLEEIASENNIVLQLKEEKPETSYSKPESLSNSGSPKLNVQIPSEEFESDGFPDSARARKKYKDVADAAQAAFESAAYAAAAARAAVELSRSDPHHPDDQNSPGNRGRKASNNDEPEPMKSESEHRNLEIQNDNAVERNNSVPTSSADSDIVKYDIGEASMTLDPKELARKLEQDVLFDDSDNETNDSGSEIRSSRIMEEKKIPSIIQAGLKVDSVDHASQAPAVIQSSKHVNKGKAPFSFRTRGVRGY